jgi:electron transfer flavoprotein alpha subunit
MARIFVYIVHKAGVADDTAQELIAAAKKIDPNASPIALVAGWGGEFDSVCTSLRTSYSEVWKIAHENLHYPNAEFVRAALLKVLPAGSIVLVPHDHFGIDLAPGLSIKSNAAFASDVLAVDELRGNTLKVVRQEFGGQISAHVLCDVSSGAVITVRPGAFKPGESAPANGSLIDKSSEIGTLSARRRYVETVLAESGGHHQAHCSGFDWSRHPGER